MYSSTHVIGIHLATYVSKSDPFRRGLSLIIFILGNALFIIIIIMLDFSYKVNNDIHWILL